MPLKENCRLYTSPVSVSTLEVVPCPVALGLEAALAGSPASPPAAASMIKSAMRRMWMTPRFWVMDQRTGLGHGGGAGCAARIPQAIRDETVTICGQPAAPPP